ncbi:cadherin-7-like [Protopterus annectens]|uniref:cadherin-7-like n=1 Tax=Protopterus annectens TaxID=7888 RepID=UPI001CFA3340|nr:cadherin-7-like [Protopterus annectens]
MIFAGLLTLLFVWGRMHISSSTTYEADNHFLYKSHHWTNTHIENLHREKRSSIWNEFYVPEEVTGRAVYVGQVTLINSTVESNRNNDDLKFILSGEGAGTMFTIEPSTGKLHAIKKLDREEKSLYILKAQVVNKYTHQVVEPEYNLIVKVQDVNDNEPQFLNGPYTAAVPEMAPIDTFVTQVTATDADDASHGNSAKLVYSIIQGQPYFSVEPTTGTIRTASAHMDRESQEQFFVIIQAKDMVGQMRSLSGTTTVTITLSDVNDNKPKFHQKLYHFTVSEAASPGSTIGKLKADDMDIGKNAEMDYIIVNEGDSGAFDIITDSNNKEGNLILKKPVDYERKRWYGIKVKAVNIHVDPQFSSYGPFEDLTNVKISVEDEDEPPIFSPVEYKFMVLENAHPGASVGTVTAKDQDSLNRPIRYAFDQHSNKKKIFMIDALSGLITLAKPLDRETAAWHNLTVSASEQTYPVLYAKASVFVEVGDVNDHAPEFPVHYVTYVCEQSESGQLLQTISAVDKDTPEDGHHFHFSLDPHSTSNAYFTLSDNQDNTAGILTRSHNFSLQEQAVFYLPIVIKDSGLPALSSSSTVTIRVCDCGSSGTPESCSVETLALPFGLSTGAFISIMACGLIILEFIVVILAIRRHKAAPLFFIKGEDIKENIVKYDDEGGGEEDTEAFDINALSNQPVMRKDKTRRKRNQEIQSLCRLSLGIGPEDPIFREFILEKLFEADNDPCSPPFNTLMTYAFEGCGSVTGSLSSLGSFSTDSDQNYDYLSELGPQFKKLADLCGHCEHDKENVAS